MSMTHFRLTLLALAMILGITTIKANQTVTLNFSEDDFSFSNNEKGHLIIISKNLASYPSVDKPGLPIFSTDIAISGGEQYVASNPVFTKRLIRSNVEVAHSPRPLPTNGSIPPAEDPEISYNTNASYPAATCEYVTTTTWGDINVVHFLTCPFVYDAKEKNLYFIDSVQLEVTTSTGISTMSESWNRPADAELLKSFVVNPRTVDELTLSRPQTYADSPDRIEYLIVTSEALKEAFEPLREWKKIKGLYAEIVTMEEVEAAFPDYSPQLALKSYLNELYINNSLEYVLLGGDETVIPVRKCSVKADGLSESSMPTDMYYACFRGNFDWDGNGNGIYGEATVDGVDLSQQLYLTRVPVKTEENVKAFLSKLLSYEGAPTKKIVNANYGEQLILWGEPSLKWNNKILMAGAVLGNYLQSGHSDAKEKGDRLYDDYIAFHNSEWTGERFRFYDTCTDFTGGSEYNVNSTNLATQISDGYAFIDMITHGNEDEWCLEHNTEDADYTTDGATYEIKNAALQSNSAYTIVTTAACLTNAFDKPYPCLSETLIQNPNSGIVAYLGCSREGLYLRYFNELGPSLLYEANFYDKLFWTHFREKNYGMLVASAKASMISPSLREESGCRWIQFGLNPVGDPEMPIFTTTPKTFDNVDFSWTDNVLNIRTAVDECRICIMSAGDNGESYYKVWNKLDAISIDDNELPKNYYICITCQGYIPYFRTSDSLPYKPGEFEIIGPSKPIGPLGGIMSLSHETGTGTASITTTVNETASSANLVMRDINGSVYKTLPVAIDESTNVIDISSLRAGLYIISLYVDGSLADSCEMAK